MLKFNLEKFKKKDRKILLYAGIVILIIIIIILVISVIFSQFNSSDSERFAREYEKLNDKKSSDGKVYPSVNISSDNVIKYVTVSEIINTFKNNGDAVVYFGYASCLYCRSVVPVLLDTASDKGLEFIYYLDIENQDEELNELYEILGDELVDNNSLEAPLVIFIVNGEVSSYNKGTLFSQEDPYTPLDTYQVKGLSGIYESGMNDVLDSIGNKKMNLSNE